MSLGELEQELAALDLGDARRERRAIEVLRRLSQAPLHSPKAALGGWAEFVAASRLFDGEACTDQAILAAHRVQVLERVRQQATVVVVQDTTELDYTDHPALEGTGPLAEEERRGFFLHTQWVVNDGRLPLGTWQAKQFARPEPSLTDPDPNRRKRLPIEEKESYRWLEGYRAACELAEQAPGVQVVSCSDREGDIYEVFVEWQRRREEGRPAAEWLVRCNQNRGVLDGPEQALAPEIEARLLAQIAQNPVLGGVPFRIPTKEQHKKVKGNRRRTVREGRLVRQEIRVGSITLRPPQRSGQALPPVTVGVVMATEIDPPAGQEPIDRILLTSLPVHDLDDALRVLALYFARWEIEVFHRVLKSGCRVEKLQFRTCARLQPLIALYMIVAWRILYLTKLGREVPDLPADVVFDEAEWKSLWMIVRRTRRLPAQVPSLNAVLLMIARLGGHFGRRGDQPPGPETFWRGLQKLHCYAAAWRAFGPDTS